MKGSGIYIIICTINNKYYIGYASDFNSRFRHHKSTLRNNSHKNIYLQRAWNKYGEENFIFEILERCPKSKLSALEHWWVIVLGARDKHYGYNLAPTNPNQIAGTSRESALKAAVTRRKNGKHKLTDETKQKISKAHRGKKMSKEMREKMSIINKGKKLSAKHIEIISISHSKIVYQYNMNREFVKKWLKVRDASKFYNFSENAISQAARTNRMANNSLWSYNKYEKHPYNPKNIKKVIGINNNNEIIEFNSAIEAAKYVGLKYATSICSSIKNGWRAGGYYWKYKK